MEPICDTTLSGTRTTMQAESGAYGLISRMATDDGAVTAIFFDGKSKVEF